MVAADHRSAHPNVPGVPWWGAVLIAVTATAIGFAYDAGSGDKELSNVFAALYLIGCVTAVLAVRQDGIFSAVVQPPLILFVSVPGAYWLFHGAKVGGLKDVLINCGYPLIERFLLMLFTSAIVLLIGVARWFFGAPKRAALNTPATDKATATSRFSSIGDTITTKMSGLFTASSDDEADEQDVPRRRHAIDRPSTAAATAERTRATKSTKATKATKAAKRTETTRSRHARPPLTEVIEPVVERPRRQRATTRRGEPPAEPRRRRGTSPGETPRTPRDPYDRRDPYERGEPHDRRGRGGGYDPLEPYDAPSRRRRAGTNGTYTSSTHHPISRVRYRGSVEGADEPVGRQASIDEPGEEQRGRRRPRSWQAETWEYDI